MMSQKRMNINVNTILKYLFNTNLYVEYLI